MKTTLSLLAVVLTVGAAPAQDSDYSSGDSSSTVAYTTPVIYQAPVIYQGPVAYYAPVYYVASAAASAVSATAPRPCASPSTVIHITGGRGTYTYSRCSEDYQSSVIYIGGRQPRLDAHYNYHNYNLYRLGHHW
jgi:hypothetical protein